ncbi:MAG: mechanosensitive ion channel family protein [Planctomycetota bacterium]
MSPRYHATALLLTLLTIVGIAPAQTPTTPPTNGNGEQPAQPAEPPQPPPVREQLKNPRATVGTFIYAYLELIDPEQVDTVEAMALAQITLNFAGAQNLADDAQRQRLVKRLGRIIVDDPARTRIDARWYARTGDIPTDPATDVVSYRPPKIRDNDKLPPLELRRQANGEWLFSAETINRIDALYADVFPNEGVRGVLRRYGLDFLVDVDFLDVPLFQWAGLFLAILLGVTVDLIVRYIVAFISRRFFKDDDDDEGTRSAIKKLIKQVARPTGLAASATTVYWLTKLLDLPLLFQTVISSAARVIAIFALFWAIYRVVDLAAEAFAIHTAKTRSKFDDLLVPLLRKASKIFVAAAGLYFVATSLNIPLGPLLATLGLTSLALGLAAKDTVENFFGSVAVITDRPFSVGDWVVINDTEGTVEELGFRSTRIRTFYNSLVTVPNATLVRASVDNYGRRIYRRYKTMISITYDTPPDTIEAFCEGVRELIRKHPHTRKDFFMVELSEFGAHSLDIILYMFFRVPDWNMERRERHRLILDIIRLADKLGVRFAFPTQTLHMYNETDNRPGPFEPGKAFPQRRGEPDSRKLGTESAAEVMEGSEWKRS